MTGEHSHHSGHQHGSDECDTTGRHGMLLFGEDPLYLSHLPMYECPHNVQFVGEVGFDPEALDLLRADRARHGDGLYTFDPVPFPIAELERHDGVAARNAFEGTLVRGHFERGGTPIASNVRVDVHRVVSYSLLDVDAKREPGRELSYLCFGRDRRHLAHELRERPSFDQVLAVRFVPGTARTRSGRPLDDTVVANRFGRRAFFGPDDDVEHRLRAGDTVTASFPATRTRASLGHFTVEVAVERELYLEINELA
ncbi:hypothetical protein [Virgisporangium aurantiacum]|uniref:Uncharacterized protein n=1 Tax=Virgisporangium aurantiacum TaxID=175570 RepID=A0A8J3ZI26_9ACTN|nr:hypothetical protein [Virgisporangium aurantiacum]GIJ64289.1 hypothetical protein Vau01_118050 [Virgisporangium aurantiacum]